MANPIQSLQSQALTPVKPSNVATLPRPSVPGTTNPSLAPRDSVSLQAKLATDSRVPQQPVSLFANQPAFDVIAAGKVNTTKGYNKANMPVPVKQALEPTFKLVDAVDPEIGKALRKLGNEDFGLAADGMHDMFAKHDIYAAWVAVARERGTAKLHFSDMILDDRFWGLRDAEKASILIHEMVHAGETPIISHFEKLFGTVYNKVKGIEWGDPVEDRAYLHQYKGFEKLGITKNDEVYWGVQTYLEDRKLIAPQPF